MTKDELYRLVESFIYDGGLNYRFHEIIDGLDEFFDSNVVIPKGENRHKDADVLHEWIEGTEIQKVDLGGDWWDVKDITTVMSQIGIKDGKYRIKPQEPVYEYQYALWYCSKRFISDHYLTEDEFATLNTQQTVELLEETKRGRK